MSVKAIGSVVRRFLGALFAVTGLLYFVGLAPKQELPASAAAFLGALASTGYMLPLIKLTELVSGALLVVNRFVPLALIVLAPVTLNILLFHVVLAPGGLPLALAIVIAHGFLGWAYRGAYTPLFSPRHEPEESATGHHIPVHT